MPPNDPKRTGQGETGETALTPRGKVIGLGKAKRVSYILEGASVVSEEPQLTPMLPQPCFRSMCWVHVGV